MTIYGYLKDWIPDAYKNIIRILPVSRLIYNEENIKLAKLKNIEELKYTQYLFQTEKIEPLYWYYKDIYNLYDSRELLVFNQQGALCFNRHKNVNCDFTAGNFMEMVIDNFTKEYNQKKDAERYYPKLTWYMRGNEELYLDDNLMKKSYKNGKVFIFKFDINGKAIYLYTM